jgi:hypothetical protein
MSVYARCENADCRRPAHYSTDRWLLCHRHAITYYGKDLVYIGQQRAMEYARRERPWLVTNTDKGQHLLPGQS